MDGELKDGEYGHDRGEIMRPEIAKIIERLESRNLAEALLINEKLRRKSTTDTAEVIRKLREGRYGESGG